MNTLNADDEGQPIQELVDAMEQHLRNEAEHEDTKPPGYGTLAKTYEWRMYAPQYEAASVRAWCLTDDKWMTWTMKVDPRYGPHRNKHTRGQYATMYNGKPVECWECQDCGQWVVK
jgi:hypothetical protein